MELTAGKLRACGWLIILVGATAIALVLIALLFKPGRIDPTQQFFNLIFYKGYLLISTALMVYMLLVFRLLLNEWFSYAKLDKAIKSLIVLYIFYTAFKLVLSPSQAQLWPKYVQLVFALILMAITLYMSIAILKGPADLFGYRKKLAVSSLISFACFSVLIVTAAVGLFINVFGLYGFRELLWALYALTLLCMIIGLVVSIFFAVVLARMFFAAARAVEAARRPQALTQS